VCENSTRDRNFTRAKMKRQLANMAKQAKSPQPKPIPIKPG
jgi:hypothetical protein